MTVLAIIDIALSLVAAGLWGGYWWMIRAFPEVPLLERFPIHTSVRQQVQQAPYFNLYATAVSTVPIAGLPPHVRGGIAYPDGR